MNSGVCEASWSGSAARLKAAAIAVARAAELPRPVFWLRSSFVYGLIESPKALSD